MTILLLSLLSVVSITLLVLVTIALIKSLERERKLVEWTEDIQLKISSVYERIKAVDDKQIFERDDDVGVVFEQIHTIIKELDDETK